MNRTSKLVVGVTIDYALTTLRCGPSKMTKGMHGDRTLLGVEFFFIVQIALIFGDCTEVSCVILPVLHVGLMFGAAFESLSAIESHHSFDSVFV